MNHKRCLTPLLNFVNQFINIKYFLKLLVPVLCLIFLSGIPGYSQEFFEEPRQYNYEIDLGDETTLTFSVVQRWEELWSVNLSCGNYLLMPWDNRIGHSYNDLLELRNKIIPALEDNLDIGEIFEGDFGNILADLANADIPFVFSRFGLDENAPDIIRPKPGGPDFTNCYSPACDGRTTTFYQLITMYFFNYEDPPNNWYEREWESWIADIIMREDITCKLEEDYFANCSNEVNCQVICCIDYPSLNYSSCFENMDSSTCVSTRSSIAETDNYSSYGRVVNVNCCDPDPCNADQNPAETNLEADLPSEHTAYPGTFPDYLDFNPIATGQEAGHVLTLGVTNPTDRIVNFQVGPAIAPGSGQTQDLFIPGRYDGSLEPGESMQMELDGFCTDAFRDAPEDGSVLSGVDTWITIENGARQPLPGEELALEDGFTPVTENELGEVKITYPGTNEAFPYTINFRDNPEASFGLLDQVVREVENAYYRLHYTRQLDTPFGENTEDVKNTIIQYELWRYTAALQGEEYTQQDFNEQMEEQYTEVTGEDPGEMNEEELEVFDEGLEDIWNILDVAGAEAKIFPQEDSEPLVPPPDQMYPEDIDTSQTDIIDPTIEKVPIDSIKRGPIPPPDPMNPAGPYPRPKPPKKGDLFETNPEDQVKLDSLGKRDVYPPDELNPDSIRKPPKKGDLSVILPGDKLMLDSLDKPEFNPSAIPDVIMEDVPKDSLKGEPSPPDPLNPYRPGAKEKPSKQTSLSDIFPRLTFGNSGEKIPIPTLPNRQKDQPDTATPDSVTPDRTTPDRTTPDRTTPSRERTTSRQPDTPGRSVTQRPPPKSDPVSQGQRGQGFPGQGQPNPPFQPPQPGYGNPYIHQAGLPSSLQYGRPVGNGNTIGPVGHVPVTNPTADSIWLPEQDVVIPVTRDGQGYGGQIPGTWIPPYAELTVPIDGICLNVDRPPVTGALISVDEWISGMEIVSPPGPGTILPEDSPWIPVSNIENQEIILTYPGTGEPFPYRINFDENPAEASGMLVDINNQIHESVDQLIHDGLIPENPLSSNPDRLSDALRQQATWVATQLLKDPENPYSFSDFSNRMADQLEENTGKKLSDVPQVMQNQFMSGAEQIWDAVVFVGSNAKVFTKPNIPIKEDDMLDFKDEKDPGINTEEFEDEYEYTCNCTYCKFSKFSIKDEDGVSYQDSFPAGGRMYIQEPQLIESDCAPADCESEGYGYFDSEVIEGCGKRMVAGVYSWFARPSNYEHPMPRTARVNLRFYPWCKCEYTNCPADTVDQLVIVVEENDCCEQIRCRDPQGALRFPIANGGNVMIQDNRLTITNGETGEVKTIDFDYNIEQLFCGLNANPGESRVFSDISSTQLIQSDNSVLFHESSNSESLSMGYTKENGTIPDAYTFSFTQQNNSDNQIEEFGLWFAVDDEECKVDAAILEDGEFTESPGRPMSIGLLSNILQNMGTPESNPNYWNSIYLMTSQLVKVQGAYGTYSPVYQNLLNNFKGKIIGSLSEISNGNGSTELRVAAASALAAISNVQDARLIGTVLSNPTLFDHVFN
jgi:hypothetical protein